MTTNAADNNHERPSEALISAISLKNVKAIKTLLQRGTDPNQKTASGYTPLIKAVQSGSLEIINLLVAHGADLDVKGPMGYTALGWAKNFHYSEEILDTLKAAQAARAVAELAKLELERKRAVTAINQLRTTGMRRIIPKARPAAPLTNTQ